MSNAPALTLACQTCDVVVDFAGTELTQLGALLRDFFVTHRTCVTSIDLRGNPHNHRMLEALWPPTDSP